MFYVSAGERPPALAGVLTALDEQHAPRVHEQRAHPHAETAICYLLSAMRRQPAYLNPVSFSVSGAPSRWRPTSTTSAT